MVTKLVGCRRVSLSIYTHPPYEKTYQRNRVLRHNPLRHLAQQKLIHRRKLLMRLALIRRKPEPKHMVPDGKVLDPRPEAHNVSRVRAAQDRGVLGQQPAVSHVQVEGCGAGPFDAQEDFVFCGRDGGHVEDLEGRFDCCGYDGFVRCGHCEYA